MKQEEAKLLILNAYSGCFRVDIHSRALEGTALQSETQASLEKQAAARGFHLPPVEEGEDIQPSNHKANNKNYKANNKSQNHRANHNTGRGLLSLDNIRKNNSPSNAATAGGIVNSNTFR